MRASLCGRCGVLFDAKTPQPAIKVFCSACAAHIDANIRRNVARLTGMPEGGVTIVDGQLIARQKPEA